jgi:CRISPR/Cas system endoribonuclease Cas6 (RAMP superfamily)
VSTILHFACWVLKFKFLILIKILYGYKAKLIMMMFKSFHHHWSKWFSCPIHLQPFMLYKRCPHTSQPFLGSQKCTRITSNLWQLNFALYIHRNILYPLYSQRLQTKWDGQIYMYKVDLIKKTCKTPMNMYAKFDQ